MFLQQSYDNHMENVYYSQMSKWLKVESFKDIMLQD